MNRGRLEINLDMNTKGFDYQIEEAQAKLDDLLATYKLLSEEDGFNEQSNEARQLRKEIEQTSNAVVRLSQQQKKAQQQNQKNWDLDLKNIKKVALGIIGIRSLYSLARKASSSYLSSDIELAEKLQSVWVGLGSFLAPILEKLSNLMLKVVGYINVFVKALTGVNYIANANAKALNKQAKAQANLNKQTQQYDFDVIRTQQDTSGGGIDAGTSGMINIPELDQGLVEKLQNLAYWLKENKTLVEAVGITLGLVFGVSAIKKLATNIATLIGTGGTGAIAGTGLAGLAALLAYLAIGFEIVLITKGVLEAIQNYKELNQLMENNVKLAQGNTDKSNELSDTYWDLVDSGKANNEKTEQYANYLKKSRERIAEQILELEKQKTIFGQITGKNKKLNEQQQELAKQYQIATSDLEKMSNMGLIANTSFSTLEQTLSNLTRNNYTVDIDIVRHYLSDGDYSSTTSGRFKAYATGGIVTQPTRALMGEAGYPEAVVPMNADYLSTLASEIAKYGNNNGGGTVNVYLDGKLIQRQMSKVEQQKKFATNG